MRPTYVTIKSYMYKYLKGSISDHQDKKKWLQAGAELSQAQDSFPAKH